MYVCMCMCVCVYVYINLCLYILQLEIYKISLPKNIKKNILVLNGKDMGNVVTPKTRQVVGSSIRTEMEMGNSEIATIVFGSLARQ